MIGNRGNKKIIISRKEEIMLNDRIWALRIRALELEVLSRETVKACKDLRRDWYEGDVDYIRMRQYEDIIESNRAAMIKDLEGSEIREESLRLYEVGFEELEPIVKDLVDKLRGKVDVI